MKRAGQMSIGLLGRLIAILLVMLVAELAANILFYEQTNRALVQGDEAHQLAEHLAVAQRLVAAQPPARRPAMAAQLSTRRYRLAWSAGAPPALPAPDAPAIRARVLAWEPDLADRTLRVAIRARGDEVNLTGALRLRDASWLRFDARAPADDGEQHRILLVALPFLALLAVSALLFRHTLRPMRMLTHAAEHIGRHGEGPPLPEAGPGEVRRVIRAFNTMQARIGQLITDRTQALAAVGHDLRTPLARLQLRADGIADPGLRRAVEADVGEMEAMVQSLLSFLNGADDPEPPVRVDVAVLAATIADDASDHGEEVSYDGAAHVEAMVRPVMLKRAIGNLVENAIHYGQRARVAVLTEGEEVVVRVDDDGPGIPADRLSDALQPFVRLDAARGRNTRGLGLGLAIVTRAAEAEGGVLRLINRPEGGLRAELRLPLR